MHDTDPSDDLLARVLANEASAAERQAVEAWLGDSAERRTRFDRLEAAWRARAAAGTWDVDRAWARVSAATAADQHPVDVIPIPRHAAWPGRVLRVAAVVAILLGAAYAVRTLAAPGTTFSTAAGEVARHVLDDGTEVVLAPRSALRLPRRYPADRTIHLEGEARFIVGGDADAPFSVVAGDYVVRDIGTTFTVRHRAGDSLTVAVEEGAVEVSHPARRAPLALAAGAAALLRSDADAQQVGATSATLSGEVEAGLLAFTDVAAASVAARLAEWHDTVIRIAEPELAARRVTVSVPTGRLDESLDVLALLLGVRVTQDAGQIILR